MSESERRRKMPLTRVLIETTRILSPQFDDAVLFLTGAQIEMLRNVTQYLNRISTYVSEYELGYYLTPTVEDYDSILAIVADLEETLMGNPNTIWGYADRWYDAVGTESVGGGITYAATDPVPEGYVYVLEQYTAYHDAGQTCAVYLYVHTGTAGVILYRAPAVPSNDHIYGAAGITLKEGDYIRFDVYALPAGKFAILRVLGHIMAVP